MSTSITPRDSLISSAVAFLQDPTVSDAPLAKRLAFLESKGLSPSETDEALRRAASLRATNPFGKGGQAGPYHSYRAQELGRDWRDWFIMSVIGGGVGYLAISLAKKFLLPALKPPTQSELDEAQARLEEKYDEAAKALEAIQSETDAIKQDVAQQGQRLDETIKIVESAVDDCLESEKRRDEVMVKVENEVEQLKETMTHMLEKNNESQTATILDLQTELKSLKSLLAPRPSTSATSLTNGSPWLPSSSTSTSRFGINRPSGIPAWQLAATTSNINTSPSTSTSLYTAPSSSITATGSPPPPASSGSSVALVPASDIKTNGSTASTSISVSHSAVPFEEDDDQVINHNHGQGRPDTEQAADLLS